MKDYNEMSITELTKEVGSKHKIVLNGKKINIYCDYKSKVVV